MKTDKEFFLHLLTTAEDFIFSMSEPIESEDDPLWGLFMGYHLVRLIYKGERYVIHCNPDLTESVTNRVTASSSKHFTDFLNKCYDQCTNEEIEEIIRFHNL